MLFQLIFQQAGLRLRSQQAIARFLKVQLSKEFWILSSLLPLQVLLRGTVKMLLVMALRRNLTCSLLRTPSVHTRSSSKATCTR